MTIPWMMNCSHRDDTWCPDCVKALGDENESLVAELRSLRRPPSVTPGIRDALEHLYKLNCEGIFTLPDQHYRAITNAAEALYYPNQKGEPAQDQILTAPPLPKKPTLKDLHEYGWAPGNYFICCISCQTQYQYCDKRAARCRDCAVRLHYVNALKNGRALPEPTNPDLLIDPNKLVEAPTEDRETLVTLIQKLKRKHLEVEDSWYSCPKSSEECADDHAGTECNCGTDGHNEMVDDVIRAIEGKQGGEKEPPKALVWTKDAPTKSGHYFVRTLRGTIPMIERVSWCKKGFYTVDFDDGSRDFDLSGYWWSGPIPEPIEPHPTPTNPNGEQK